MISNENCASYILISNGSNEENTSHQEISEVSKATREVELNETHQDAFLVTPATSICDEVAQVLTAAEFFEEGSSDSRSMQQLPQTQILSNEPTIIENIPAVEEFDSDNDKTESEISDSLNSDNNHFVRRSTRDPTISLLDRNDIKILVEKIQTNQPDTIILKVKDHLIADISSAVIEAIIMALTKNKVCQALYIQNLSKSIGDSQLKELVSLLRKRKIWCLNIGETYEVSNEGWQYFCDMLPNTSVTHLYVSEHVISAELKTLMRSHIRDNRKKHNKHCSVKNLKVIEKCTNMWWNPINGIRHHNTNNVTNNNTAQIVEDPKPVAIEYNPTHTQYWQEGLGKGGETAWRFSCVCKETCSSYEDYRFHPGGRMFECSLCSVWSHTDCVLGEKFTDEQVANTDVLCRSCEVKSRRALKFGEVYKPPVYASSEEAVNSSSSNARQNKDKKIASNKKSSLTTSNNEVANDSSRSRSCKRKKSNEDGKEASW